MPKLRILFKIDVFVDIQTRLLHLFNNLEDTFLQSTLQIECSDILQSVPLSSVIVHISNPNQTHLKQLIKVFRMQLGSFFPRVFQNQNVLYCQVCLHIQGICFHDRSSTAQQNDSDRTKNTNNKKKNKK